MKRKMLMKKSTGRIVQKNVIVAITRFMTRIAITKVIKRIVITEEYDKDDAEELKK